VVEYAGPAGGSPSDETGSVELLNGGAADIAHCTIQNGNSNGLYVTGGLNGAFEFTDNAITSQRYQAVDIPANRVGNLGTGNDFSGNGDIGGMTSPVRVRDGDVVDSTTWLNQETPYVVTGGNTNQSGQVDVLEGATLTIEEGSTIAFVGATGLLTVGNGTVGNLVADASGGDPITFTTTDSDGSPTYWRGIYFYSGSDVNFSKLKNVVISYGGSQSGGNYRYGNVVFFSGGGANMEDVDLTNGDGTAGWVQTGSAPYLVTDSITASGNAQDCIVWPNDDCYLP
jgi:hypothetical protein